MKKLWLLLSIVTLISFQNCARGFKTIDQSSTAMSGSTGGGGSVTPTGDPLYPLAWHLSNTGQADFAKNPGTAGADLNLQNTWAQGIFGNGIKVLVSDDGVESNHEDLKENYNFNNLSKNYNLPSPYTASSSEPTASDDNHGTSVSGLIAAVGGNGVGSIGVAPKAQLICANFLSSSVTQSTALLVNQASGDFDVYNNSWGDDQQYIQETDSSFKAQLKYAVTNYRSTKGSLFVKAGGNSFALDSARISNQVELGNANFDSTNTTPYSINVAALSAKGESTSYSSPGANLWVSSLGGEDGVDDPAIVTTDRSGCSNGYAVSSATGVPDFDKGLNQNNLNCNYTATFDGTSAATPLVTGAVALLLEANPNLTWRDVKYILAKTARQVDPSATSFENPLYDYDNTQFANFKSPTGYTYEQGWVTNSAGFKYHNWYGFGLINIDAAIAMAKSYTSALGTYTETNFADKKTGLNLSIPDFSAIGVSSQIVTNNAVKIEAVQLRVAITHANIGELALELTSPSGTKSIVVNMNNALDGISNYSNETLLTNAFLGESSQGTWTLKVIDGRKNTTGTLTGWSLNFIGGS